MNNNTKTGIAVLAMMTGIVTIGLSILAANVWVKVEFEGLVQKWKEDSVVSSFVCVDGILLRPENLTLLAPAKPKLAVGQVWKDERGYIRKIIDIHGDKVAYWYEYNLKAEYGTSEYVDKFIKDYAHELISEGENG